MLLNRFCFRHISHYAGLLFRVYADWRKERAVNLEQLIGRLKKTPSFMENVTHWETIPAKEASFAPFPAELDNRLPPVLAPKNLEESCSLLYGILIMDSIIFRILENQQIFCIQ